MKRNLRRGLIPKDLAAFLAMVGIVLSGCVVAEICSAQTAKPTSAESAKLDNSKTVVVKGATPTERPIPPIRLPDSRHGLLGGGNLNASSFVSRQYFPDEAAIKTAWLGTYQLSNDPSWPVGSLRFSGQWSAGDLVGKDKLKSGLKLYKGKAFVAYYQGIGTTLPEGTGLLDPLTLPDPNYFGPYLLKSYWPNQPTRRYVDLPQPIVQRIWASVVWDRYCKARADGFEFAAIGIDNLLGGEKSGGQPPELTNAVYNKAQIDTVLTLRDEMRRRPLAPSQEPPCMVFGNVLSRATEWIGDQPDNQRAWLPFDAIWAEQGSHKNIRINPNTGAPNPEIVEQNLAALAAWVHAGRGATLIITALDGEDTAAIWAGLGMMIYEPDKPFSYWIAPRSVNPSVQPWDSWPQTLGKPHGAYGRTGSTFIRVFDGGTLIVDTRYPGKAFIFEETK